MEPIHLVHTVPPALRDHVASAHGYAAGPMPGGVHRGLPSRHLTLVVEIAAPLSVRGTGYAVTAHAVLGGLHLEPALVTADRRQEGLQYSLTPLGVEALLGVPAGRLGGLSVPLADVLGRRAVEVTERVAAADGWPSRFRCLDRALVAALDTRHARVAPEVREAWRMLVADGTSRRVAEVAEAVGWSRRHLLSRFRSVTGVTPKQAQRIARFEAVRGDLVARPGLPAATLASMHGYADQQHLAREWRSFAGCSLGTWLREEFPFVHDTGAADTSR